MPVVGFLNSTTPDADRLRAFRQGLKDIGYVEGENVAIESVGPRIKMTGCPGWPPNWCAEGSP
jgi:hypothetical protein